MTKYRHKIILKENTGIRREKYPVVLKLRDVFPDLTSINWQSLKVEDGKGKPTPSQADHTQSKDHPADHSEIVFQIDLMPFEQKEIYLKFHDDFQKKYSPPESDLHIIEHEQKMIIENSKFRWELTEAENAEFRLKNNGQSGDSWNTRIWTYAGQGHNRVTPLHDFHYQRRRFLNQVSQCEVVSSGPVRAVMKLYYDFIHFEENLDVECILKVYSGSPLIEKISTSHSGEPAIVLATMLSRMGYLTLADGAFCGSDRCYPINSPRIYPKVHGDVPLLFERDMNFQPIGTQHDPTSMGLAAHKTISGIDGYTWGAIWNPRSRQGKADIALLENISGYFLGWEQDQDASSIHPLTDRAFADFIFHCDHNRTFRHYTTFFTLDTTEDTPHKNLNEMTKSIANPVEILYGEVQKSADGSSWERLENQSDRVIVSLKNESQHYTKNSLLDLRLKSPFKKYQDEKFDTTVTAINKLGKVLEGVIDIFLDERQRDELRVSIPPYTEENYDTEIEIGQPGVHTIKVIFTSGDTVAEVCHQIEILVKPILPFIDFCLMLRRPDKRTLHGNLLRYWGGQIDIYWEEFEHETLGFTHAWLFNGKSWGSYSERDWEFWRKEQTAIGSLYDHTSSTFFENLKPVESKWEPGRLDLEYAVNGIDIKEKKFIFKDVLTDIIQIENTTNQNMHFSLFFKGKGHGMSEAMVDEETGAILIKNHAYAYTGLNQVFYASIPFSACSFADNEEDIVDQISKGYLTQTETVYGNPAWYAFQFEVELKPGEQKEFSLGFIITEDYKKGFENIKGIVFDQGNALEAVRWDWNHWFNDQVPRFNCNNEMYYDLYYYIWFVYRCNVYDVGKGWYKYPYVAPTSTTYFNTMFGWDSAFHTMIGKWLRNPEDFVYGNQKNWSLVQAPCGFLPEIFGRDWRQTWTGGNTTLLAVSLHEMFLNTGDLELVNFMYPVLKKYEQWRACEVEYSPYWMEYHNNITDFQKRKDAFASGRPWVDTQVYYYRCLADIAKWAGDSDYQKQLLKKADSSIRKFRKEETVCSKQTWDETKHATHIGGSLFWSNGKYANPERVEELIQKLFDPDIYGMTPPIPGWPLNYKRPGDGWDHGGSVTTVFFTIEGLFRYGKYAEALKLLERMIEISFIETEEGLKPTAPEYWDEKAKPWGCIEYAWQGLLTNLMIERICGIRPDVPARNIVVEPHFPEGVNSTVITVPLAGEWIDFIQEFSREKTAIYTLTVKNTIFDTTLRLHIPDNGKALSAKIDGHSYDYTKSGDYIEVTVKGRKNFTITVEYNWRSLI